MERANEFIAHEFAERKKANPNFSLRAFSRWLGLSPAQVSQMITGKRKVTLASLKLIASRVGLSPAERESLFAEIMSDDFSSRARLPKRERLDEDRFRLIADRHHFAILALTKIPAAKADPRWIARKLDISVEQANQAIMRLERLGLLSIKPFKQITGALEASSDKPSPAIRKYHKQSLQVAAEKIDTIPNELREFQSIVIAIKKSQLPALRKIIDRFLDRASAAAEEEVGKDLYHLNVQLFPISKLEDIN
jgi:uncharacterized protein (TIGR02147 family)